MKNTEKGPFWRKTSLIRHSHMHIWIHLLSMQAFFLFSSKQLLIFFIGQSKATGRGWQPKKWRQRWFPLEGAVWKLCNYKQFKYFYFLLMFSFIPSVEPIWKKYYFPPRHTEVIYLLYHALLLCSLKTSVHFFQNCISKLLNRICHLHYFLLCLQNRGVFTAALLIIVKISLVFSVLGEQVVCSRENADCKK